MRIITVSREFGSGGRELGRRLAEELGYDYYDGEIIAAIAKNSGLDANYVENALEDFSWQSIPMTVHRTFASPMMMQTPQVGLLMVIIFISFPLSVSTLGSLLTAFYHMFSKKESAHQRKQGMDFNRNPCPELVFIRSMPIQEHDRPRRTPQAAQEWGHAWEFPSGQLPCRPRRDRR